MTVAESTIVLLLLAISWLWYDSMGAREAGVKAVRTACAAEGLQLLDETIAITRLRPGRDRAGRFCWFRAYQFDYSETGENRRSGVVHLLGRDVVFLNLGLRPTRETTQPRWLDTE